MTDLSNEQWQRAVSESCVDEYVLPVKEELGIGDDAISYAAESACLKAMQAQHQRTLENVELCLSSSTYHVSQAAGVEWACSQIRVLREAGSK